MAVLLAHPSASRYTPDATPREKGGGRSPQGPSLWEVLPAPPPPEARGRPQSAGRHRRGPARQQAGGRRMEKLPPANAPPRRNASPENALAELHGNV